MDFSTPNMFKTVSKDNTVFRDCSTMLPSVASYNVVAKVTPVKSTRKKSGSTPYPCTI